MLLLGSGVPSGLPETVIQGLSIVASAVAPRLPLCPCESWGLFSLLCPRQSEYTHRANCFFLYFVLTQEPQTTVIHNPDGNKVCGEHSLALSQGPRPPRGQSTLRDPHTGAKPYPWSGTLSCGPDSPRTVRVFLSKLKE